MNEQDRQSAFVLGRFALLSKLALGGMGTVYLARTEGAAGFRKPVAVKLIHPHLMDDESAVRSFIREAKLAARLVHPNIVQVVDFGEHEGLYLTVLEYVHGYHLGQISEFLASNGRPLSVDHAAYVMYKVLRGLEFAHNLGDPSGAALGLVHRDISPHNVLISDDGQVKLTDFGVARVRNSLSQTGGDRGAGKLAYMAPEQVSDGAIDHRTDLFACGIVFYELLTGTRLFAGEHEAQTVMRVSEADVPDIETVRPGLGAGVKAVLDRALARAGDDRYQSAADFAAALRGIMGGQSPDDIERPFQQLIAETLREPAFADAEGALFDLEAALKADAISVPGTGQPAAADAPAPTPVEAVPVVPEPPEKRGLPTAYVALLGLLVMLLVGGGVVATAIILRGGNPPPTQPMAVIINQTPADAGATPTPQPVPIPQAPGADASTPTPPTPGPSKTDSGRERRTPQSLSGITVTQTLMKRRNRFRACFARHKQSAPGVDRINIRVVVAGSGAVQSASVEPATVQSSPAGQCVLGVAKSTRFPRHPEEAVAFRVPMRVKRNP